MHTSQAFIIFALRTVSAVSSEGELSAYHFHYANSCGETVRRKAGTLGLLQRLNRAQIIRAIAFYQVQERKFEVKYEKTSLGNGAALNLVGS